LRGGRIFRWEYPFFGLTDDYKAKLHDVLFDLTHFGNFEYNSSYEMPVQYRTFYLRKLISVKEKEKADMEKSQNKVSADSYSSPKIVKGPQISKRG
jgi:hypothetical protein